jgi:MFS family permease
MTDFLTRLNVRKSLKYSTLDGAAAAAMTGLTQNYITPFALAFQATTMQIGLLSSFPSFAMAFSQLATPWLVDKAGNRKRLILPAVMVQALMWLPIFLIPYLLPNTGVWWLIGLFTVGSVASAVVNPAWQSMMADLVPIKIRGRYFSFRGRIYNFTILIATLGAGLLLQAFTGNVFIGFAAIFGAALLFRVLSFFFLTRMYDPPVEKEEKKGPGLFATILHMGKTNAGKFTIFMMLFYFSIMFAGPFFSVYMLRDLGFDYLTYTLMNCASTISTLVFLPFWGRRADRAGNLRIIKITASLMPFVPLVWLVSSNPIYLIFANAFNGFIWSGFDLSSINFLYDVSDPKARTRQIAIFNCITSVALSLGALAGGYVAPHLPSLLGYELRTLFTISGVMRGAAAFFVLRGIMEIRHVPKISILNLMLGRRSTGPKKEKQQ